MISEILQTFDESRNEYKPYGLTCEMWSPHLMRKPDRHNEIEINYIPEGSVTYLFQDKKVTVPQNRLAVFWGLVPHQIVHHEEASRYFVCTIPFTQFLEWKLPATFVEQVLKGEVLIDEPMEPAAFEEHLLQNWVRDIKNDDLVQIILLEMRARLCRMALRVVADKKKELAAIHSSEVSQVERVAIYIAQNYATSIRVSDIGRAVGLHPDYTNALFKKAFGTTLSEYITSERIAHAQRKLISTDKSITEIAFECGFNSISRFNAAFLKMNGCTPRVYRKGHC